MAGPESDRPHAPAGGRRRKERPLQIVGVARDGKVPDGVGARRHFIYVPIAQQFMSEITFYVRRGPDGSRINELRRAVIAFDPNLPVIHTSTLEEAVAIALLPQRIAAWIAASVGGSACSSPRWDSTA